MPAGSLSINAGPLRCNLACPYCVSKMSYRLSGQKLQLPPARLRELAEKFLEFSGRKAGERLSGIITSKGEATQEPKAVIGELVSTLDQAGYIPELQTNGTLLDHDYLSYLRERGLQVVAISCVSHLDEVNSRIMARGRVHWQLGKIVREAIDVGLLVRLTAVLTRGGIDSPDSFLAFMRWAEEAGVKQATMRKMGEPRNLSLPGSLKIAQWIRSNYVDPGFIVEVLRQNGTELEPWPWACRFDYHGISVVITDHMTAPTKEVVRHGVIQPDGHLYGSWDDPADIII